MPGKPSRARREQRIRDAHDKALREFFASGGQKRCGTCGDGYRCPMNPSAVMPCWWR